MITIGKVESFSFDKAKRRVIKFLRFGKSDGKTGFEVSPYGIDSGIPSGFNAVSVQTQQNGRNVIIGYINENQIAELGSVRLYSENGQVYLRKDGNLEVLGTGDFMVRYNALEAAFNELQDKFNTHVHLSASPGLPNAVTATPSTGDITGAKCPNIKTV